MIKKIRPEILFFAEHMERVMQKHDFDKGDSWKECTNDFLFEKISEEFTEIDIPHQNKRPVSLDEFVDLANVCMMMFYNNFKRMFDKTE